MSKIEADLLGEIKAGNTVLFLGAGASRGALHRSAVSMPDGQQLAAAIASEFLSEDYAGYDLKSVCDLAANRRDVRSVQSFIHDYLIDFQPAEFHKLLPTIAWAGLVTTNYDLIVERAYQETPNRIQNLQVRTKDADGPLDTDKAKSLYYLKIHGCIIEDRADEAQPIFQSLKAAPLPYHSKREVKGIVKDESGEALIYQGSIKLIRDTFGFVESAKPRAQIYFDVNEDYTELRKVQIRSQVSFKLGFRLFGPTAFDVTPLLL